MNKSKLLLLVAAPMMLASCNGISKCNFEKFQEKVTAIDVSGVKITKTTIKGKVEDEKYNFVVEELGLTDVKEAGIALIVSAVKVGEFAVAEAEDAKYFVGMGFKVTGKEDGNSFTACFDKYGNCTKLAGKVDGSKMNLSISYKYSK